MTVEVEGRTLLGLAVPFDEPAAIFDRSGAYIEVFKRGAFRRHLATRGQRLPVLISHDAAGRLPVGATAKLWETDRGLNAAIRLSRTSAADEVLELVRDRAVDGLSISFIPGDQDRESVSDGGLRLVERVEAELRELSIVVFPAYAGARISAVRQHTEGNPMTGRPGTSSDRRQTARRVAASLRQGTLAQVRRSVEEADRFERDHAEQLCAARGRRSRLSRRDVADAVVHSQLTVAAADRFERDYAQQLRQVQRRRAG